MGDETKEEEEEEEEEEQQQQQQQQQQQDRRCGEVEDETKDEEEEEIHKYLLLSIGPSCLLHIISSDRLNMKRYYRF